jgi:2-methylcitrate dehydratase PrpD
MPKLSTAPATLSQIAHWLHRETIADGPAVEQRARLLLLDTIGCFIAAQTKPEPAALARDLAALEPGPIHLPGTAAGLSVTGASMAIAVGACWDEACEGLARAHGRPGLHAIPAVLATALARDHDLGSALDAIVTGYEVGGRLGKALRIRPGMHVDGAWGALGAAAGANRILGGTSQSCVSAVLIVACQIPFSLYAPVAAGDTARNIYCGHGATLGLHAALAARAGMTAPQDALSEYNHRALGGAQGPIPLTGTGEYLILEGYLKPFAAVRHVHYGAQAALNWRRDNGRDTSRVSAISLKIYSEAIQYCGNRSPTTGIQAQFSLSQGLAWMLFSGSLGPEAYTDDALNHPEVHRLENLVQITPDPTLDAAGSRGATLTITTGDTSHQYAVTSVPGDPDTPLSDVQVREKFLEYTTPVIGQPLARKISSGLLDAPLGTKMNEIFATR